MMQTELVESQVSKKQAKRNLIDAMNEIKQKKNNEALNEFVEKKQKYFRGERNTMPAYPTFRDTFTYRNIDQAVFMARQIGGHDELLIAAGYRPYK
jgi:hypothetical protein